MKKLQSSLGVKLFSFNTKIELISKIKQLAAKRNVSQAYFELLNEVPEVDYDKN